MNLSEHQRLYTDAIRQARQAGDLAFHTWFNMESSCDMNQVICRGYWDMSHHILTPTVCAHIQHPEECVALEIGYGGGRLLNAACSFFGHVIGIDIHDEHQAVERFLHAQKKTNVRLLRTDGATIGVDDNSIDLIYSFIVLQHLPSFGAFASYIRETRRCLQPGGVAQLYFGSFGRLHPLHRVWSFLRGYRETKGKPANHVTLHIRTALVRRMCRQAGLRVVETGTSFYRAPDGYPDKRGGQSYVTLVKPCG